VYWEDLRNQIERTLSALRNFDVKFVDEKLFPEFINHLKGRDRTDFQNYGHGFKFLDITGYFSEGISDMLSDYSTRRNCKVRLVSPELKPNIKQDMNNLTALRKMQDKGVEIRVSPRIHARLLVGYPSDEPALFGNGVLLLGSFDFNREGLSGEKINAGIITQHPNLVRSARDFQEDIGRKI